MKHVSEPLARVIKNIADKSPENKAKILEIIKDLKEQAEAKQAAKEQQAKYDKAAAEKAHNERFNGYSESLGKDYSDKNFSGMMGWRK